MLESCGDSEFLAEVPTEIDSLDSTIHLTELIDLLPGQVWRSIIHEYDLILILLECVEHGEELRVDIGNIALFTIGGDDDGDEW